MTRGDGVGLVAGLVGVLALCGPATGGDTGAPPEPEGPRGDTVRIQVMAIEAGNGGACDPRLEFLRSRLRRVVSYRSFRLVGDMQRDVLWQDTEVFVLPHGTRLLLLPKGREAQEVLLQVRLVDGRRQLVDTIVRLRNRGYMVFGVERDARADEALLVVLRAED